MLLGALTEWIRNGAKYDEDGIAQPTGIEVRPKEIVMTGEDVQIPFSVRAT